MDRSAFGKTWWGQQWLQALSHIDFDNRLPRGRSYANKGAVRDLDVRAHRIAASVQGSRPTPYEVSIAVPVLAADDAQRLLERIAADPALIARLLNRQLDPAVLELAQSLGIRVFPQRWSDLKMRCSCPDWAVPCKHLAAVIYLLSRQIDGDPFLVFSLRGLDLPTRLAARGIHIQAESAAALPMLEALLTDDTPAGSGDPVALERMEFSAIPQLGEPIWRVLPAAPSFFPHGDFAELGQRVLSRVSKAAARALDMGAEATDPFGPDDRPTLLLDSEGGFSVVGMASAATVEAADPAILHDGLARLAPHRLADLQPGLAELHSTRLLALHLLARGAVVPQIHASSSGVRIRWQPAMLDAEVRGLMTRLSDALPHGLVCRPAKSKRGAKRHAKLEPLGAQAQAAAACGFFLDHAVRAWSTIEREKPAGHPVLKLFFAGSTERFDGPGQASVPGSIQAWLSRLHLDRQAHVPVLQLDENLSGAFQLTLGVERSTAAQEPPVPLADVLGLSRWAKARFAILQQVSVLSEFYAPLADHLRHGAVEPVQIASDELPAFLFDTLPAVRLLGVRALLPKALERLLRPRLSMRVKGNAASADAAFLSRDDVFGFDWQVAVGDHLLSRTEFDRLVKKATGVVRFKGEFVYLDPAELERLRGQLAKPPQLSSAQLLQAALAEEYAGAPIRLDAKAQALVRQLLEAGDMAPPPALRASLRPYQQRGYAWLYRNVRLGLGSVLADDMGLGKTLQVIAALQQLKDEGALTETTALVVVPTSLLTNWQKELARFAPTLSVGVFHGTKRELGARRPEVLLTTYGVARSEAAKLKAVPWALVIVDEAQNIKNPAAAQTKAIKALPARSFIAMSGTPVENRLSEYWSIMDFANRGYLGSLANFSREYAAPIQIHRDVGALQRFKRITAPFLLRRLKSDKTIISDLPDKIEQDQFCSLTPSQVALYESVVQEGLRSLEGVSDTFRRQGLVLQMILALKQICNHPAHYLKRGALDAPLSGKGERLIELVDEIHDRAEKVLVFTQFREMGELLCGWLAERHGRRPPFLHGGVGRAQRDAMVDRFQNDRTERVFVLSLKAGGTGLNLTAASHVIHYDLWWNPAVEAQATDRAFRIGQQRNVQVHRLVTRGTFEERINEMMISKRELAELTVASGEQWIGKLPVDELRALFAID
jgi:superfamily II DNA or RNA helicase